MPPLRLHLLGTLDIRHGDQPLPTPPTLKSQSLLAYLALRRDQPQPRYRLASLFWGDRPERRARQSLATALWHIRRCLPQDYILSDPHTIQFDPQAELELDVDEFESCVSHDDMDHLQTAVVLYRGDFMDGFYDDWIINERYRLETLFSETLTRLMVGQEAKGEHSAALATALRLLDRDPLREGAHRLAMRAYCRLGQRSAAIEQYHRCQKVMLEELGAEPMAETIALYQAILDGRFEVGRAPAALPISMPATIPPGRNPLEMITPGPLVGREKELASLRECWQEAETGQGRLVLISGEAGVGKTRLIEEFSHHQRWQGVRVLWGRCYEFERVLPYQPVAEALRTILSTVTSAEVADLPARIIAEVARLAPEIAERFPSLETPASISFEQEQARLFDGVARFLSKLSSHGALLIVLEDLHWASESTLQLLHYLTRHLADCRLLMVGTLRPEVIGVEHPLSSLQRQLTREQLVKPLPLSRLSAKAVEAMVIEMSAASEAVAPLARRLYQETEGNPFFVIEIVKTLFETGLIHLEGGVWKGDLARIGEEKLPLPASLSEAIQSRVGSLGGETQAALRVAAVLGREFDFDLLNAVWGQGEEATLEALDDLLRHRLIEEGAGAMGRDYAFTHHKIQEVVYAGMPRRHRQHAHARSGAAMENLYRAQAETLAGELAYHFEQGRELDKALTEKAIIYLLQAGDRAHGQYAHQEAIDYYQRALVLLKEQGDYERAARTLMRMGLTYHTAFDFGRARQAYDEGFALWQRAGETEPAIPPPPAPHALRVAGSDPTTLNPTMLYDMPDLVLWQLFSGLATSSPEREVIPDVAQGWEVSEGGRKYVFHLRDDARWSDGVPVTAGDFEYTWKRVLDPATGSPWADLLYDVKGARPFHQGVVSDPASVEVQALDETTLVVELEGPIAYFLHLLLNFLPVPRHVVEAHGDAWTEPGSIVTNGPFKLESWQPGESLVLVRNPEYHGPFGGNLQRVKLSLFADPSTQLEMYEADHLDILDLRGLPPPEMDRVRQRHAGEYVSLRWSCTQYVGFDVSRPPFNDPRVRRAFVLATDQEKLADVVLRGSQMPATGGLVPPGMPGHSAEIGLPYDPDRARQLLAEAGYPGGHDFPAIDAQRFRRTDEPAGDYLQAQWRQDLGVEIVWKTIETHLELERKPPQMFLSFWLADYPDPDSFLRASPVRRWTRWRNADYDRLVDEARRVADQGKRIKMYQEADRILIEAAAIMPLTYDRLHLLVKPWVTKYPMSAIAMWFWKDVTIEPH